MGTTAARYISFMEVPRTGSDQSQVWRGSDLVLVDNWRIPLSVRLSCGTHATGDRRAARTQQSAPVEESEGATGFAWSSHFLLAWSRVRQLAESPFG